MNLPTKLIHMKTCGNCFRSLPVEAHGCPTSPQPPRPQIVQPFQKCSGQLEFNMNKLINTTFSRIFMKHMFFEYSQCPWFHISNPLKNNNGIHHRSTSVDPSVSQVCLDLNSSNLMGGEFFPERFTRRFFGGWKNCQDSIAHTLENPGSPCQMMIGVDNHLRNERYLIAEIRPSSLVSRVGGWTNPWMKNMRKSKWIISPKKSGMKIENVWNHHRLGGSSYWVMVTNHHPKRVFSMRISAETAREGVGHLRVDV